jgi:hypothetical protein
METVISMAEWVKGSDPRDAEVYEFASIEELIEFRKSYPEVMKNEYSYALYERYGKQLVTAEHFKQFRKAVTAIA